MTNDNVFQTIVTDFMNSEEGKNIKEFIKIERKTKTIYPESKKVFLRCHVNGILLPEMQWFIDDGRRGQV